MPSKEVFIPKSSLVQKGVNLAAIMGNKTAKGEVGLEIEVEGKNLPQQDYMPKGWSYHVDHSLRGEENAEYVLSKPVNFKEVPALLRSLWGVFKEKKSRLDDSNRTSVHVHVNCQEFFLNRLTSFMALYFIVEELLTEWCGEHRVGNLFCLRAKDAPGIVRHIKNFIMNDGNSPIQEFLHYSALNANALKKFGSLELRTLRGCADPVTILDWVEIIQRLYELSAEYPDPRSICDSLSSLGELAFAQNILGPCYNKIRSVVTWTDSEVAASVYEGVRIAQDLCYCRDWDLYKPVPLKTDPFGRNAKVVAKKIINQVGQSGLSAGAFAINTLPPMVSQGDEYFEPEPEYDDDLSDYYDEED